MVKEILDQLFAGDEHEGQRKELEAVLRACKERRVPQVSLPPRAALAPA